MLPTYANLEGYKNNGTEFQMNQELGTPVGEYEGELLDKGVTASFNNVMGGKLVVAKSPLDGGDKGLWAPYAPKGAFYGYVDDDTHSWAGSGPFSGCEIAIGNHNGRIYMAHLSMESGSKAKELWANRGWDNDTSWGQFKVPLPSDSFFSCSHVFVTWTEDKALKEIVRIDVKTPGMGSSDGEIFNIETITL